MLPLDQCSQTMNGKSFNALEEVVVVVIVVLIVLLSDEKTAVLLPVLKEINIKLFSFLFCFLAESESCTFKTKGKRGIRNFMLTKMFGFKV